MTAFPKSPEQETGAGGMAETGDQEVTGIVGGELLVLKRGDVEIRDDLTRDQGGKVVRHG